MKESNGTPLIERDTEISRVTGGLVLEMSIECDCGHDALWPEEVYLIGERAKTLEEQLEDFDDNDEITIKMTYGDWPEMVCKDCVKDRPVWQMSYE